MGLFLRERRAEPVDTEARFGWPQLLNYLTTNTGYPYGSNVSTDQALRASAVWACVRVLAGSASMLPVDCFRGQGSTRLPVEPQPSMVAEPSALTERDVWVHQLVGSMYTDGNGWGVVTAADHLVRPTTIETVNGQQVTDRKVVGGVPQARIEGEIHRQFPHGDLWFVPGPMVPAGSPFGLSPISYGSTGIDASLLAETFGRDFFSSGGHPTGLLQPDRDVTEKQADDAKRTFLRGTEGRAPAVLGQGWKFTKLQTDPNDSQFLDLLRFEVENTCRRMGVPPSMVYASVSGQSVTYANVSQADLHYLKHSLEVPLSRLERAWSRLIARPQYVRLNRDALLRSDALARWQVHDLRLKNKTTSVNAVRALEDEPPFPDDEFNKPGVPGGAEPTAPPTQEAPK